MRICFHILQNVIPAEAGIQDYPHMLSYFWIPASAGMTKRALDDKGGRE